MTKTEFITLLHEKLGIPACQVEPVVNAVFEELRDIIAAGEELTILNFGRFYPKVMSPRVVRGGLKINLGKTHHVPGKIKVGFASFPNCDKYTSSKKRLRRSLKRSQETPFEY